VGITAKLFGAICGVLFFFSLLLFSQPGRKDNNVSIQSPQKQLGLKGGGGFTAPDFDLLILKACREFSSSLKGGIRKPLDLEKKIELSRKIEKKYTISTKGIVQFWSCNKAVANVFPHKAEPSSATRTGQYLSDC